MLIYKVTNTINGKVYIGLTINSLEYRRSQHQRDCNRKNYYDNYFHNALIKYGFESFIWEILEECEDLDTLNELEIKYIKEYNSQNKEKGYNLKAGGKNGGTCTEETKAKIGATTKLKWQNPEIAAKMREGLRKGTEIVKARAALNFVERECPTCHKVFKCRPGDKKVYCDTKCAANDPKNYMKGLNAANEVNAKRMSEKDSKNVERIKEWVAANTELLTNVKYNKLTFLSDLASYLDLKDVRSVQRILKAKNRKDLVNKLIEIMNS